MDEGVDPTKMCQSLVNKVAQSKQLQAVTDPEILVLFEDWLNEIENEVVSSVKKTGSYNHAQIAEQTGLSRSGANFIMTKLKREGRL
jgi:CRP-like cAMP-binding protein